MSNPIQLCLYNVRAGRAYIVEPDGRKFILEVKADGTIEGPKPMPEGLHLGMWLQPAEACVSDVVGEYPYVALKNHMLFKSGLQLLMRYFVPILDPQIDMEFRHQFAAGFEEAYAGASPEIKSTFDLIVLNIPIPNDTSTRDAPFLPLGANLLTQMVARHGHRPLTQP